MKSHLLFPLIVATLLFTACGTDKIPEGQVTYELTYPHMDTDGLLSVVLPDEMTIVFKGTKMKTTIKRGKFFETCIISDEVDKSIEMYVDVDNKHLHCKLTPEEIDELMASLPEYSCKKATEQDSIAGVFCSSYEISSSDSLQPSEAWFTENFEVQNAAWFSSYESVKGFPMVYDIERYGIFTHAEAIDFVEKEVGDSVFVIEGDYTDVDFETYEKESQELFDILINW
jgi:major membrane immunogen (membrane-anchored lipoprotein)